MSSATATIRELRTDFRAVKRKIEQHGEVTITDHGQPTYVLRELPRSPKKTSARRDYFERLIKRQPTPMSAEKTNEFWEDERR